MFLNRYYYYHHYNYSYCSQNEVSPYLPLNVFGIISIVSGLLTFLLPETRNVPLPETLEEGEMLGKTIIPPSKDNESERLNEHTNDA